MRNASWPQWLLLLTGLGAVTGCAQMPGGTAYAPVHLDSHLAAERYLAPTSDPDGAAQTHALAAGWAKMGNGSNTAPVPAVVAASREEPVTRTSAIQGPVTPTSAIQGPVTPTSAIQMSALQPPASLPVSPVSDAGARRTLWDKQPWEVELDNMVRGICRGC